MADYKIVDAGKLEEDLTLLADAIRQRSGTSGKMDFPSGMADTVANIPSEGLTLPELADPATARDMVLGKQLYDSSGQPVTGNIPEFSGDQVAVANISELYHINNFVRVTGITSLNSRYDGLLLRPGTQQRIFVPDDQFGDADAGDVAKGKTFTSAAGLLVEGTHECQEGLVLPPLGDSAAAPADMLAGKVLYDEEGNPVTGTLHEESVLLGLAKQPESVTESNDHSEIRITTGMYTPHDFIGRSTIKFRARVPSAEFGDATADQVAKGATFTSAAGLLVEGTMEAASGGGIPYATGSFTLAVEANRPVITHNLNSTKVFVMYSVRENPAIYTRRYSAIMGVLISNGAYPTRTIDISSYTTRTDITEVIAGPDNKKNHTYIDVIAPYNGDDYFGTGDGYFANTDPNSFTLYTREVFLAGLTFDWVAVDISGVLPWAEEG